MGNCALKPKVLSEVGAPVPEELKDSLLEDHKNDAAKCLSNLFLQDKAEKKVKEDEKTTPEKMPVTEDLKTALKVEESPNNEAKSPAKETKIPETETKITVIETTAPAGDQNVMNEEAVRGEEVIANATAKETEAEAKPEEVEREAAQ
ncbi:unnamed protein product [Microthlaspi erraticum]|uniref:Uncharacterized protein n=1 Tax=Microthlaspi erraticum TaxID=1685480 RepID=A0A6D2I5F9_9BRAS|nr:unnamed protein product [Microthlaspi erraticum]